MVEAIKHNLRARQEQIKQQLTALGITGIEAAPSAAKAGVRR
jgi:hypothetical protein